MADTDIYKNQQRLPTGKKNQKSKRRTRTRRRFDEPNRKRRSKNSGLRRLGHLFRKSENEKAVWYTFFFGMLILLVVIAVWQFWYLGYVADKDALRIERGMESPAEQPPAAVDPVANLSGG